MQRRWAPPWSAQEYDWSVSKQRHAKRMKLQRTDKGPRPTALMTSSSSSWPLLPDMPRLFLNAFITLLRRRTRGKECSLRTSSPPGRAPKALKRNLVHLNSRARFYEEAHSCKHATVKAGSIASSLRCAPLRTLTLVSRVVVVTRPCSHDPIRYTEETIKRTVCPTSHPRGQTGLLVGCIGVTVIIWTQIIAVLIR